jgi:hypothetical protein
MKRFHYCKFAAGSKCGNAPPAELHNEMRATFLSSAQALGRRWVYFVRAIEVVISINEKQLPYRAATILRECV